MGVIERIEDVMGVKFSEDQIKIIKHEYGPANIISCAGSGKTTLLVASLLYRQMKESIDPCKTCVISFNKTAVDEIEERYLNVSKELNLSEEITFKTFHALYYMILKYYYYLEDKGLKVLSNGQANGIFNKAFYSKSRDKSDEVRESMQSLWGYAINNLIKSKNDFLQTSKFLISGVDSVDFFNVIEEYNRLKEESEVVDFDDLQLKMLNLLQNNEEAQQRVKEVWDYWYIDEYQDISKIQMEILKLSIQDENNIVTIGDEDQSIYQFRGSKVDYIVDFPIYWKNSKRYIMGTNYRCPENILSVANRLIKNNKKRIDKEMCSYNQGGEVNYLGFKDDVELSLYVADSIYESFVKGEDLFEIAVLYRNNNQSMFLVDQLLNKGVPFSLNRNGGNLSDHLFVRDILNIVEFALDDKDVLKFKKNFIKVTNFVKKKEVNVIGNRMLSTGASWRELVNYENGSILKADKELKVIQNLVENKGKMHDILDSILCIYSDFLEFLIKRGKFERLEIDNIISYLKFYYGNKTYKEFVYCLDRGKSVIDVYKDMKDTVKLKTMHTVKGLEYDKVFLLGINDNVIPNSKFVDIIDKYYGENEALDYIEQERRLYYVACTRAKKELIITYSEENESFFIEEQQTGGL